MELGPNAAPEELVLFKSWPDENFGSDRDQKKLSTIWGPQLQAVKLP